MKTSNVSRSHPGAIIDGWVDGVALPVANDETLFENGAGVAISAGDVVALEVDGTVVTTVTAQDTRPIGVALDNIAWGALGSIVWQGPVPKVNVTSAVTAGRYAESSTTAGKATESTVRRAGSFGEFTSSGIAPTAFLFGGASGGAIQDILDLPTAETTTTLVLAPDGAGGVEFRVEGGGGGSGITSCRKGTNESFSSTSYANSTSMSLSLAANTNYAFKFLVYYTTNATSVGIKLAIKGPASCTAYAAVLGSTGVGGVDADHNLVAGVQASADISTDLEVVSATAGPGTTATVIVIEGTILNGATAGSLLLRHASETATATTILGNSRGELYEIA